MNRMVKAELPGVEHEAGGGHFLAAGVAVDGVAEDGEAEAFLHMHADLVGAACEQFAADESGVFINGELFPLGDGFLPGSIVKDGHAFAIHGVAADHVLDAAAFIFGHAVDGREVDFAQTTFRKGFGEAAVGDVVLGNDHAAAGVLIQTVDDAGAHFATDPAEVIAVMEERIDQRAVWVSGRRMHDETRGFVQDEDVLVLEKNLQWDVLSNDFHRGSLRNGDGDGISSFQGSAGFGWASVQSHVSVAN